MAVKNKRKTTPAKKGKLKAKVLRPAEVDPVFQPIVDVFANHNDVGCGKMFSSNSVLNVNGKIFAMYARGKFVAKLPRHRVDALVKSGCGERFDPGTGRLMKEWIAVRARAANWLELAMESYDFVKQGKASL